MRPMLPRPLASHGVFTSLRAQSVRKHSMMNTLHNFAAMEKTYDNAVRILTNRQRQRRPVVVESKPETTKQVPASSGTPDLRGTPSIVGMSEWLQCLGHSAEDINALNIIHVAGTKGKGSTCAFTESFLRAHGTRTGFPRKTGLYTSPHLILPEERIRINAEPLAPALFAKYFFEVFEGLPQLAGDYDSSKGVVERGPRFLQLFALFAFHVFIRENVDVTILETHSGGEYDATNVVQKPIVTAVTTLGMDHVAMLGPTIENIAWHKAGIFKPGAVALSAPQDPAPASVLKSRSVEKGEQVRLVPLDPRLPAGSLPLKPSVQKTNASLAAAAAEAFLGRCAPQGMTTLSSDDLARGVEMFSWPGRFQLIREGPGEKWNWYLDAAHNDMSVAVAAEWFAEAIKESGKSLGPRILIFSHINELRDSNALLQQLGNALNSANVHLDHVIFSTYDETDESKINNHAINPDVFHKTWSEISPQSKTWSEPTIQGAIALARRLGVDGVQTLITGSQHLVGPALRVLEWHPATPKSG